MNKVGYLMLSKIRPTNQPLQVAFFASLGSAFEYYDFVIYGMMAKYFREVFFPHQDESMLMMQTFTIFAVGYLVRPFGGTFVGMIADVYGRKKTFIVIMLTMSFSTLAIGLLPSYNQIGILAPIGLLLLRICQGLSFGAELPGATTIVSEFAPKNKLGKLCSILVSSTSIGAILASFVLTILTNLFSEQDIVNGLWRLPFIIGGVLAIVSYYIRKNIFETPEYLKQADENKFSSITAPFKSLWKEQAKAIAIGFGLTFFIAVIVIMNLYFPTYLNTYFEYTLSDIYSAMTISLVLSAIFLLFLGWLSDYISKTKMLLFCLVIWSLTLFPLFILLNHKSFGAMVMFFIVYQLFIALYYTSYLPILSRLFTTSTRYTGIAFTYNSAFSLASIMPILASLLLAKVQSPYVLSIIFIMPTLLAFASIIVLIITIKNKNYMY